MATAATEYTVARACESCSASIPTSAPKQRRLCDRCRHRRRGLTFVRQALAEVDLAGDQRTVGELEVIAGRLELAR